MKKSLVTKYAKLKKFSDKIYKKNEKWMTKSATKENRNKIRQIKRVLSFKKCSTFNNHLK